MSEQITDLARRFDRASYDLAKSLVKLDETQKHPEMSLESAKTETMKHLVNVAAIVEQIAALDVLQDERRERC